MKFLMISFLIQKIHIKLKKIIINSLPKLLFYFQPHFIQNINELYAGSVISEKLSDLLFDF